MKELDLVMWTYNSQATLEESLSSIDRAIPHDRICHRIMVDGHSSDSTEKIARRHGWEFYETRPGIPLQANFGLKLVDTDNFASFEHDIVLSPSWLSRIEKLLGADDVVVAQGVRLSKGVPSLEALDRWSYSRQRLFYSLDNTLYKTEAIRDLGGYPLDCPMTADGLLRRKVLSQGLRWVTDTGCISWHLRSSFPDYLRHVVRHFQRTNFFWESEQTSSLAAKLLRIFFTSPVVGARIASKSHTPSLLLDYPLLRYVIFVTMSVLVKEKKLVLIPGVADEALLV